MGNLRGEGRQKGWRRGSAVFYTAGGVGGENQEGKRFGRWECLGGRRPGREGERSTDGLTSEKLKGARGYITKRGGESCRREKNRGGEYGKSHGGEKRGRKGGV